MIMTMLPIALGILDPLYSFFGWIMRGLYYVFANYGVTIIVFTIFLRAIMIPLYVKQHKTSLKQGQLTDEVNELKRRYKDDQQGFAMAQQALFKEHKISMFSGCLPQILALILIWPIWRIISQPLHYVMGVSLDNINTMGQRLVDMGLMDSSTLNNARNLDITVINLLRENGAALTSMVKDGLIQANQLLNLDFLGINLGLVPTLSPAKLFGDQWQIYLPTLIIPLVAVVSSFFINTVTERTNPTMLQAKRDKELAKLNPARDNSKENAQMETMNKSMKYMMPIMTLMTVFFAPGAMGLYWIVGNLMMIVQSLLLYYIYTKPVYDSIKAQEERAKMKPAELAKQLEAEQALAERKGKAVSKAKNKR
ncbi:MAG: YidC/Oxa1 family membrane protein insertase [Oscillospiraceae bacterium]|nr:YidC/Oxa1 family membrane protein insertase [Oscillospiraceae bacterium]MDD4369094.1 YidC/Oxa1 family membrane protein insertase [Oscillospiraceae bacterium]